MESKVAIEINADARAVHWIAVFAPQAILFRSAFRQNVNDQ